MSVLIGRVVQRPGWWVSPGHVAGPRTMRLAQQMPSDSRIAAVASVAQPSGSRTRNAASDGAVRARTPRKAGAIAATTRAERRAWAVAVIMVRLDRTRSTAAT